MIPLRTKTFFPSEHGIRIDSLCKEWEHTPFLLRSCSKGVGVDCSRFVCSILDELANTNRIKQLRAVNSQQVLHSSLQAKKAIKTILRAYPELERSRDDRLIPGDILVTGPHHGGPSHLQIVGHNKLWHSLAPVGVVCSAIHLREGESLFAIYRPNKQDWKC